MAKCIYYIKNIFKNIVYGILPALVLRVRKPSGRPSKEIDSHHIDVFNSYFKSLGVEDIEAYIDRKIVVEIGPGDILGTAFYALVYGAGKVICIDRFPLAAQEDQKAVFSKLIDYLPPHKKSKAYELLDSDFEDSIIYISDITGNFGNVFNFKADIVLSNAVLEHVYDLRSLFDALRGISTDDTIMFHGIDLRSHKMHYRNQLDFLSINNFVWKLMTCYRGAPNRLRKSDYLNFFEANDIKIIKEILFEKFDEPVLNEYLATAFTCYNFVDLEPAVVGFICKWK